LLAVPLLHAADWPHWLGPNGDNIAPESGHFEADLNKWSEAWKAKVGRGYSSMIVSRDRAYTIGHDEKSQETVRCLDIKTGDVIWSYSYDAQLLPKMHPGGPNASPTVVGDRVITLSKDGQIFCLSADKGKELWKANLGKILEIEKLPAWRYASSAVVDDGRVLFSAGKVAALDLKSGKTLWTSKNAYHPGLYHANRFQAGR
jgi:outer membrane protein assembly factor BamB